MKAAIGVFAASLAMLTLWGCRDSDPDKQLINPANSDAGTIEQNIARMTKLDMPRNKPWVLAGWSQANRLSGNRSLFIAYGYFSSESECQVQRKWNIAHDPPEFAAHDASSRCALIGRVLPLPWKEIIWNPKKRRWIDGDRYTGKIACENELKDVQNHVPELRDQCRCVQAGKQNADQTARK